MRLPFDMARWKLRRTLVPQPEGASACEPILDHDDFALNQSKIMNAIDSHKLERDAQISLRNLRKLDCDGKPVPTFPHPALGDEAAGSADLSDLATDLIETASSPAKAKTAGAAAARRLAALLMGGALVSKGLGFVRELMMAQVFGASLVADGFRGAMTATLLPLALLQNESVPAVLIPMHRDWQEQGDAPRRLAALTIALTLLALAVTLCVAALGHWWVLAVVGGYNAEGQSLTLGFLRLMVFGMPASVMLNCLSAAEIALGRSRLTTLRAAILNLAVLLGIALAAVTGQVLALGLAFSVAFNGLAAWGLWSLWREGQIRFDGLAAATIVAEAKDFLHRLRPLLPLPFAEQGNVWLERLLASRLMTGTVASLDYARTLTDTALLLISQPLGLAVLSSAPASNNRARIEAIAKPILAMSIPASMFLAVFAPDVARLVFARGAFQETAILLTSEALRGVAVGLWAATLGWILLRLLNSTGRNMAAAIVLASAYGLNAVFNLGSSFFVAPDAGPLWLGLGESLRGFVLLGGIALLLGCASPLMRLIAIALPSALLMAAFGWLIEDHVSGLLSRLSLGVSASLVSMTFAAVLLMPEAPGTVLRLLRRRIFSKAMR